MWVNFAGLSAQVVFAAWVKLSLQSGFVKKCLGVARQVDVPRFGLPFSGRHSLIDTSTINYSSPSEDPT